MLSEEQLARVTVVLVRARNPNNIGAVARAMHGFGFSDLRLVNDYSVALEKAKSAVDASAILASARLFPNVADAVADCNLVVGTTAVGERKQEHSLYTLAQAATRLRSAAANGRVALLFGSEKTGLSNDAMSHCHWLMTIPMHPSPGLRHASMNLGQAAAVCLYELIRAVDPLARSESQPAAQAEDLDRVTHLLAEMLISIGYAHRRPAAADPAAVRRMVLRLHLNQSDARRWIGVLRQLLWKISE
ncbi:MAG: TrmH family RNA methyltransferase [Acidobacteriaceae bacterium]